jgi:hypothetical protein
VHAAAADTIGRHEGAPGADWKAGLVHLVSEGEHSLVSTKEEFVTDAVS